MNINKRIKKRFAKYAIFSPVAGALIAFAIIILGNCNADKIKKHDYVYDEAGRLATPPKYDFALDSIVAKLLNTEPDSVSVDRMGSHIFYCNLFYKTRKLAFRAEHRERIEYSKEEVWYFDLVTKAGQVTHLEGPLQKGSFVFSEGKIKQPTLDKLKQTCLTYFEVTKAIKLHNKQSFNCKK